MAYSDEEYTQAVEFLVDRRKLFRLKDLLKEYGIDSGTKIQAMSAEGASKAVLAALATGKIPGRSLIQVVDDVYSTGHFRCEVFKVDNTVRDRILSSGGADALARGKVEHEVRQGENISLVAPSTTPTCYKIVVNDGVLKIGWVQQRIFLVEDHDEEQQYFNDRPWLPAKEEPREDYTEFSWHITGGYAYLRTQSLKNTRITTYETEMSTYFDLLQHFIDLRRCTPYEFAGAIHKLRLETSMLVFHDLAVRRRSGARVKVNRGPRRVRVNAITPGGLGSVNLDSPVWSIVTSSDCTGTDRLDATWRRNTLPPEQPYYPTRDIPFIAHADNVVFFPTTVDTAEIDFVIEQVLRRV